MPAPLSEAMVRDLYTQRPKPGAVLVTLAYEGWDEPFRATDWPEGLTVVDGAETLAYRYAPFRAAWGGGATDEPSRSARLEIGATGEIVELIRSASGDVGAVVERVRVSAPNQAERTLKRARVGTADVQGGTVTVTLKGHDYSREPAVAPRYTKARTPSL